MKKSLWSSLSESPINAANQRGNSFKLQLEVKLVSKTFWQWHWLNQWGSLLTFMMNTICKNTVLSNADNYDIARVKGNGGIGNPTFIKTLILVLTLSVHVKLQSLLELFGLFVIVAESASDQKCNRSTTCLQKLKWVYFGLKMESFIICLQFYVGLAIQ